MAFSLTLLRQQLYKHYSKNPLDFSSPGKYCLLFQFKVLEGEVFRQLNKYISAVAFMKFFNLTLEWTIVQRQLLSELISD